MKEDAKTILDRWRDTGWVIEPEARKVLKLYGLYTAPYSWAMTAEEAVKGAGKIGYPLVAKIVSADIIHKSDVGGVVVGVRDDKELLAVFTRLSSLQGFQGVLLDEMQSGFELIIGSKHDPQFGPVVLIGIGGTSVEIYQDVAIRMAPVTVREAKEALLSLHGSRLMQGYRGKPAINMGSIANLIAKFSEMVYDLRGRISSIDLNPVMCSSRKAVIADARIIL